MSSLMATLLRLLIRGSQSKILGSIFMVLLRRLSTKTKNTIDDEIVEVILKDKECVNDEASRVS